MNTQYDYEMNEELNTGKFISGRLNNKPNSFRYVEQATKRNQKTESIIAQLPNKMKQTLKTIAPKNKETQTRKHRESHKDRDREPHANRESHQDRVLTRDIEQFEDACVDAQEETRDEQRHKQWCEYFTEMSKQPDLESDIETPEPDTETDSDPEWTAAYHAYFKRHIDEITEELENKRCGYSDLEIYDMSLSQYYGWDDDYDYEEPATLTEKQLAILQRERIRS